MNGQMRIYYDHEGDFLEIMFGEKREDYGDYITDDIFLYKNIETDEVIGIGIFNFKKRTRELKNIKLDLPINITLESLKKI